jgi:hypothetical protein
MAEASTQTTLPRVPVAAFVIPDRSSFLQALDLSDPALAAVKVQLERGDTDAAETAFMGHFRSVPLSSPLLPDWTQIPRDPEYRNSVADDCLAGRLVDGYNVYDVPDTGVDWHRAPLFCMPRFPIFRDLLLAAHHTGDLRYVRFIVDHSLEYIDAYPIESFAGISSNEGYVDHYTVGPPTWWCLLPERHEEWANALTLLRHSADVSDEELLTILHRMLEEVRYLMTQIPAWVARRHNAAGYMIRVTAMLSGLYADFTESRRWQRDAGKWFRDYLGDGFYPDGLYKELTLGYTSSVSAQASRTAYALRDVPGFDETRERLSKMVTALIALVKPMGDLPAFGDGPSRPLSLVLYEPLVKLLEIPWMSALLAAEGDGAARSGVGWQSWAQRRGPIVGWLRERAGGTGPEPPFTEWPEPEQEAWGGYYSMRSDWSRNAAYLMIDGGPWGTTHRHMDRLSFVLSAFGADFITDPSNTKYASNEPEARLSMLNAGFLHNTITVDGVDEFVGDMSECEGRAPLDNIWETGEGYTLFEGWFDFDPVKDVRWTRRVLFVDKSYWLMQDVLVGGQASARIEQNFQFEEDIVVVPDGDSVVATAPNGAQLLMRPLQNGLSPVVSIGDEGSRLTCSTQSGAYREPSEMGHGRGWISRVINHILPAPAVTWCGELALPVVITMALIPLPQDVPVGEAPEINVETIDLWSVWDLPVTGGTVRWRTSVGGCAVEFQLG